MGFRSIAQKLVQKVRDSRKDAAHRDKSTSSDKTLRTPSPAIELGQKKPSAQTFPLFTHHLQSDPASLSEGQGPHAPVRRRYKAPQDPGLARLEDELWAMDLPQSGRPSSELSRNSQEGRDERSYADSKTDSESASEDEDTEETSDNDDTSSHTSISSEFLTSLARRMKNLRQPIALQDPRLVEQQNTSSRQRAQPSPAHGRPHSNVTTRDLSTNNALAQRVLAPQGLAPVTSSSTHSIHPQVPYSSLVGSPPQKTVPRRSIRPLPEVEDLAIRNLQVEIQELIPYQQQMDHIRLQQQEQMVPKARQRSGDDWAACLFATLGFIYMLDLHTRFLEYLDYILGCSCKCSRRSSSFFLKVEND